MSIKDIFQKGKNKVLSKSQIDGLKKDLESEQLIRNYLKNEKRVLSHVDYSDPSKFVVYGSAKKYYEDSIERIYRTYPYDGSLSEKAQWWGDSSDLDIWILENLYPKESSSIRLGNGQYIYTKGGPNKENSVAEGQKEELSKQYPEKSGASNIWNPELNRNSNLYINPKDGNTIEFWAKLDTAVISGDNDFIPFTVGNQSGVKLQTKYNTSSSTLSFIYVDDDGNGISGAQGQIIVDNLFTSSWNHYSFSFVHNKLKSIIKIYKNSKLQNEIQLPVNNMNAVSQLDSYMVVNGAINENEVEFELSGSIDGLYIDDYRFWKTERTEEEIGRYWFTCIHGGTNTDNEKYRKDNKKVDIGVYYKFNEGYLSDDALDSTVLDYSGRISNGTIVGYTKDVRTYSHNSERITFGSAIDESGFFITQEKKDPIIYSNHNLVKSLKEEYSIKGAAYDHNNNASMYYSMPNWIIDEDFDFGENLLDLTQALSSYFDSAQIQISRLTALKDSNYHSLENTNDAPFPLVRNALESKGMMVPDLFVEATAFEEILSRGEQYEFEKKISDVKNIIYQNIYNNLPYIYKSKGTEKSFRNLLRCFGIDDEVIKINLYANEQDILLENNSSPTSAKKKFVDFNNEARDKGVVYTKANPLIPSSQSFVSGMPQDKNASLSFTLQTEIIFPASKDISRDPDYYGYTNHIEPIAYMAEYDVDNGVYLDEENGKILNIKAVKTGENINSKDVRIVLEFSDKTLETKVFKNVFDNQRFNIAARLVPKDKVLSIVDGGGASDYQLELYCVCSVGTHIEHEDFVKTDISRDDAISVIRKNKFVSVGAIRENSLPESATATDLTRLKISSTMLWYDNVTNEEVKSHCMDILNYGRIHPNENAYSLDSEIGGIIQIPRRDTLAFHWDFSDVKETDASGDFVVTDVSEEVESGRYGWFTELVGKNISGKGIYFSPNDLQVVNREFVHTARQKQPEAINPDDLIKIRTFDDEIYKKDPDIVRYFFSIEKSMYSVINDDIINFFASIKEFNDLIGQPVNRYRMQYKSLEKFRNRYFERVKNVPSLEKYVEIFKWLDSSIGVMLYQLIPASSAFSAGLRTMVESHVLERNKYWNKLPTIEMASEPPLGIIRGINELTYNWKDGSAPVSVIPPRVGLIGNNGSGASSFIDIEDSSSLEFGDGDTDSAFSISLFAFVPDTLISDAAGSFTPLDIISKDTEYRLLLRVHHSDSVYGDRVGLYLRLYDDSVFSVDLNQPNEGRLEVGRQTIFKKGEWHHIAVTYDGSSTLDSIQIYIDGVHRTTNISRVTDETAPYVAMEPSDSSIRIGENHSVPVYAYLSNVAIFNTDLAVEQIVQLYKNHDSSAYINAIARWQLNGVTTDSIDINEDGSLNGVLQNGDGFSENPAYETNFLWFDKRVNGDDPNVSTNSEDIDENREAIRRISTRNTEGNTVIVERNGVDVQEDKPILRTLSGATYEAQAYVTRALAKPYKLNLDVSDTIHGGVNYSPTTKDPNAFIRSETRFIPGADEVGITVSIGDNPVTYEEWKKLYTVKRSTSISISDTELDFIRKHDGDLIYPYYGENFKDPSPFIVGHHNDSYGDDAEIPAQGPFTETWVGGNQHRHVDILKGFSTIGSAIIGSNSAIVVDDHPLLTLSDGAGQDYSAAFSFWLKPNFNTGNSVVVAKRSVDLSNREYMIYINGNGRITLQVYQTSPYANYSYNTDTGLISTSSNKWHHVVVNIQASATPDTSRALFYIDGVLVDSDQEQSATYTAMQDGTNDLVIGNLSPAHTLGLEGELRDLVIFNFQDQSTGLVQSDINHLLIGNVGRHPKANNIVGWWKLYSNALGYPSAGTETNITYSSFDWFFPMDRPELYVTDEGVIKHPQEFISDYELARYTREEVAKRPINIKNIKTGESRVLGNYARDYEVVQTSGRTQNNRWLTKLTETQRAAISANRIPFISGSFQNIYYPSAYSEDYTLPDRLVGYPPKPTKHVFTERFSAPGDPLTLSQGFMDSEAAEYSVYNSINFRNLEEREKWQKELYTHSDKYEGSNGYKYSQPPSPVASVHKINRNTNVRPQNKQHDNAYISHQIPRSDIQYTFANTVHEKYVAYAQMNRGWRMVVPDSDELSFASTGGEHIHFNGTDEYVVALDSDDLSFVNEENDGLDSPFSAAFFANFTNDQEGTIFEKMGEYSLVRSASFGFSLVLKGGGTFFYDSNPNITPNALYHVAVTYDGQSNDDSVTFYLDGVPQVGTPFSDHTEMQNTVGMFRAGYNLDFMMSDFVLFNKELNQSEVTELRQRATSSTFSDTDSIISWWTFDRTIDDTVGSNDFNWNSAIGTLVTPEDNPFSITARINIAEQIAGLGTDGFLPLIEKSDIAVGQGGEYVIYVQASETNLKLVVGLSEPTNTDFAVSSFILPSDKIYDWMNVTITYDGQKSHTGIKLYINSDEIALDPDSSETNAGYLGMINTSQNFIVSGAAKIRDVAVFNKELTQSEAEEIYLNYFKDEDYLSRISSIDSVVSWWTLKYDLLDSVSSNHGTFNNDATLTPSDAPIFVDTFLYSGYYDSLDITMGNEQSQYSDYQGAGYRFIRNFENAKVKNQRTINQFQNVLRTDESLSKSYIEPAVEWNKPYHHRMLLPDGILRLTIPSITNRSQLNLFVAQNARELVYNESKNIPNSELGLITHTYTNNLEMFSSVQFNEDIDLFNSNAQFLDTLNELIRRGELIYSSAFFKEIIMPQHSFVGLKKSRVRTKFDSYKVFWKDEFFDRQKCQNITKLGYTINDEFMRIFKQRYSVDVMDNHYHTAEYPYNSMFSQNVGLSTASIVFTQASPTTFSQIFSNGEEFFALDGENSSIKYIFTEDPALNATQDENGDVFLFVATGLNESPASYFADAINQNQSGDFTAEHDDNKTITIKSKAYGLASRNPIRHSAVIDIMLDYDVIEINQFTGGSVEAFKVLGDLTYIGEDRTRHLITRRDAPVDFIDRNSTSFYASASVSNTSSSIKSIAIPQECIPPKYDSVINYGDESLRILRNPIPTPQLYHNTVNKDYSESSGWINRKVIREVQRQSNTGITENLKPTEDSYEDFSEEVKLIGQNYSIIPEYRISEHMDFHLLEKQGNFLARNFNYLTLDGASYDSENHTRTSGKLKERYDFPAFEYYSPYEPTEQDGITPFRLNDYSDVATFNSAVGFRTDNQISVPSRSSFNLNKSIETNYKIEGFPLLVEGFNAVGSFNDTSDDDFLLVEFDKTDDQVFQQLQLGIKPTVVSIWAQHNTDNWTAAEKRDKHKNQQSFGVWSIANDVQSINLFSNYYYADGALSNLPYASVGTGRNLGITLAWDSADPTINDSMPDIPSSAVTSDSTIYTFFNKDGTIAYIEPEQMNNIIVQFVPPEIRQTGDSRLNFLIKIWLNGEELYGVHLDALEEDGYELLNQNNYFLTPTVGSFANTPADTVPSNFTVSGGVVVKDHSGDVNNSILAFVGSGVETLDNGSYPNSDQQDGSDVIGGNKRFRVAYYNVDITSDAYLAFTPYEGGDYAGTGNDASHPYGLVNEPEADQGEHLWVQYKTNTNNWTNLIQIESHTSANGQNAHWDGTDEVRLNLSYGQTVDNPLRVRFVTYTIHGNNDLDHWGIDRLVISTIPKGLRGFSPCPIGEFEPSILNDAGTYDYPWVEDYDTLWDSTDSSGLRGILGASSLYLGNCDHFQNRQLDHTAQKRHRFTGYLDELNVFSETILTNDGARRLYNDGAPNNPAEVNNRGSLRNNFSFNTDEVYEYDVGTYYSDNFVNVSPGARPSSLILNSNTGPSVTEENLPLGVDSYQSGVRALTFSGTSTQNLGSDDEDYPTTAEGLVLRSQDANQDGDLTDTEDIIRNYRWAQLKTAIYSPITVSFRVWEGGPSAQFNKFSTPHEPDPTKHEHLWFQYKVGNGRWITSLQVEGAIGENKRDKNYFNSLQTVNIGNVGQSTVEPLYIRWLAMTETAGDDNTTPGAAWAIGDIKVLSTDRVVEVVKADGPDGSLEKKDPGETHFSRGYGFVKNAYSYENINGFSNKLIAWHRIGFPKYEIDPANLPFYDWDEEFLNTYAITDSITNISKSLQKNNEATTEPRPNKIKLKVNAVKKLLPYDGFYPQDRTVQIADLFIKKIEKDILPQSRFSTDGVQQYKEQAIQAALQHFFAPGILYNSIKSGIACDWASYTNKTGLEPSYFGQKIEAIDENRQQKDIYTRSLVPYWYSAINIYIDMFSEVNNLDDAATEAAFRENAPLRLIESSTPPQIEQYNGFDLYPFQATYPINNARLNVRSLVITGMPTTRLPFESILDPYEYLTRDTEKYIPSGANGYTIKRRPGQFFLMAPSYYKDFITDAQLSSGIGPSYLMSNVEGNYENYSFPYFEIKNTATFNDVRYELAINNFLAESVRFFLKSEIGYDKPGNLRYFRSKREDHFRDFKPGNIYKMDISLERKEKVTLQRTNHISRYATGPSEFIQGGRYYGPPSLWFYDPEKINILRRDYLHREPAFAPYVPSYFYGKATATIGFVASSNRHTIDEIHEQAVVLDTSNGAEEYFQTMSDKVASDAAAQGADIDPSAQAINWDELPAYRARMPVSASVELFGKARLGALSVDSEGLERYEESPGSDLNAWTISTRYECPIFDFSGQSNTCEAERMSTEFGINSEDKQEYTDFGITHYASYFDKFNSRTFEKDARTGAGVWSGVGQFEEGAIQISLSDPYAQKESLAYVCGFQTGKQNIGEIAHQRHICEAVVMIPFIDEPESYYREWTTEKDGLKFIKIPTYYEQREKYELRQPIYSKRVLQPNDQTGFPEYEETRIFETSVTKMMDKMKKYIIPPRFDFVKNESITPFAMYIFEFEHILSTRDLKNIWEGLQPQIAKQAVLDSEFVEHDIAPYEILDSEYITEDILESLGNKIKWLVFKVKKKAEKSYYEVVENRELEHDFRFNISNRRQEPDYGYNYPYDYFTMLEKVQVVAEVKSSSTEQYYVNRAREMEEDGDI